MLGTFFPAVRRTSHGSCQFSAPSPSVSFFERVCFCRAAESQPGGTAFRGAAQGRVSSVHQDQGSPRAGGFLPRLARPGRGQGVFRKTGDFQACCLLLVSAYNLTLHQWHVWGFGRPSDLLALCLSCSCHSRAFFTLARFTFQAVTMRIVERYIREGAPDQVRRRRILNKQWRRVVSPGSAA